MIDRRSSQWWLLNFLLCLLTLGTTACQKVAAQYPLEIEPFRLPESAFIPLDNLVTNEWLLLDRETDQYGIWNGSALSFLEWPDNTSCTLGTTYHYVQTLGHSSLIFIQECHGRYPDRYPINTHGETYLVQYDLTTGVVSPLFSIPLYQSFRIGGGSCTLNGTQCIIQTGVALNDALYLIDERGITPWPVTVNKGEQSWSIANGYQALQARDAAQSQHEFSNAGESVGVARHAIWSPDDLVVALFASRDPRSSSRESSLEEYCLNLVDVATLDASCKLTGLYEARDLRWAPDGSKLIFQAAIDSYGNGLWLYDVERDRLYQLAAGEYGKAIWDKTGQAIITVKCHDALCKEFVGVRFNLRF